MKQSSIIAIVLAVLIALAAVQGYQLTTLKSKLGKGSQISVNSASAQAAPLSTSGQEERTKPLPSNIENLPQMVGGC